LSLTSAAPAEAIAAWIDVLASDCCSSIATSLPARSESFSISGRVITTATLTSLRMYDFSALRRKVNGELRQRFNSEAVISEFV
jgi:hypothetical protein